MNSISLVAFDLDGTLLNTKHVYYKATEDTFTDKPSEYGITIGKQLEHYGREQLLENLQLQEFTLNLWLSNWYKEEAISVKPFSHVLPLLDNFQKQGIKCVINTNRPQPPEKVQAVLKKFNLHDYFSFIETSLTAGAKKPEPDGLLNIMKKTKLNNNEILYVGDSVSDVISGKRAGIKTIALTTGIFNKEELEVYEPFAVEDSLKNVSKYL